MIESWKEKGHKNTIHLATNNLTIKKLESHHQCKRQTYSYINLNSEESSTMTEKISKVDW
jgi:uncharacterized protein YwgA